VDTLPIQSVEIITKKPCWLKPRATAGLAAQHVDLRFEAGRFRHSRLPQHVAGLSRKVGSAPLRRNSMFLSREASGLRFTIARRLFNARAHKRSGLRSSCFGDRPPEMDGRPELRTRSRQTKLRRGSGSPVCLVEQGYGICGARDEPAHAGQQQQLVDQLGHDSPKKRQKWGRSALASAPL
jgi:hypothetical protein